MNNETFENQTLGARIAALRKEKGLTQEQLADLLGVTFQAVSKWENEVSCPDVLSLPLLADTFCVSIDELFGHHAANTPVLPTAEKEPDIFVEGLPWPDGKDLMAVVYQGHRLLQKRELKRCSRELQFIKVEITGEAANVTADYGIEIHGNVAGDVNAGDGVQCGDVGGSVNAGDGVTCGSVAGNVNAGDGLTCTGSIEGNVSAGDGVTCGTVNGSVSAGDSVACTEVGGSVTAGDSVRCGTVKGNVKCSDRVQCGDIYGEVRCDSLTCGGIKGAEKQN